MKFLLVALLFLAGAVSRGDARTICAKYTRALFTDNTGANQLALLTAVVDLAFVGNATLKVPGLLDPSGGIADTFTGAGPTSNRGGKAVILNFLDGAAGFPQNRPTPNSNTARLTNHLYQFFGALLGCRAAGFPDYTGFTDMMKLHKFMGISPAEINYFITQIGLSAKALGVSNSDVRKIAKLLSNTFGYRCSPRLQSNVPYFLVGTKPSICQDVSCPVDPYGTCPSVRSGTPPSASPPY